MARSRHVAEHRTPKQAGVTPLFGLLPYALGTMIGMIGLFDIVHETFGTNHDVRLLTYALIVAMILLLASVVLLFCCCCWSHPFGVVLGVPVSVVTGFGALVVVLVFYSDLVLAAVQGNWLGVPSDDNTELEVMYWIYYVAKRLPMLSF